MKESTDFIVGINRIINYIEKDGFSTTKLDVIPDTQPLVLDYDVTQISEIRRLFSNWIKEGLFTQEICRDLFLNMLYVCIRSNQD